MHTRVTHGAHNYINRDIKIAVIRTVMLDGAESAHCSGVYTQGAYAEHRPLQIGAENSSFCGAKGRLAQ